MAANVFVDRELWGGHATAKIPTRFEDISKFRDVPHHQEVFADATTDESLSFELMEYIPTPSLEEAARIHWGELAFFNQTEQDPTAAIVLHKPLNVSETLGIPPHICTEAYLVVGRQSIAKYNEQARNIVHVMMVLARMPAYRTDIIITFNVPSQLDPNSSSAKVAEHLANPESELVLFQQITQSFRVLDYNLFNA